ncbi:MAG: type II toxin-antitoxin system PemK/MazF family toxin [Cyclonatronaceae bacterium]
MERLVFGDIVLLKFPFTDGKSYKKRPALIINDYDDGDVIVCRITSQIYDTKNDYYLDNWMNFGLKLPSVVRVHKIATLDKSLVEKKMGKLDELSRESITQIIKNLTAH